MSSKAEQINELYGSFNKNLESTKLADLKMILAANNRSFVGGKQDALKAVEKLFGNRLYNKDMWPDQYLSEGFDIDSSGYLNSAIRMILTMHCIEYPNNPRRSDLKAAFNANLDQMRQNFEYRAPLAPKQEEDLSSAFGRFMRRTGTVEPEQHAIPSSSSNRQANPNPFRPEPSRLSARVAGQTTSAPVTSTPANNFVTSTPANNFTRAHNPGQPTFGAPSRLGPSNGIRAPAQPSSNAFGASGHSHNSNFNSARSGAGSQEASPFRASAPRGFGGFDTPSHPDHLRHSEHVNTTSPQQAPAPRSALSREAVLYGLQEMLDSSDPKEREIAQQLVRELVDKSEQAAVDDEMEH